MHEIRRLQPFYDSPATSTAPAERFPPLQLGVIAAAERTQALLVTLENVYAYGATDGKPMTEDLPLAATTIKGRTRAAMTKSLTKASDEGRLQMTIGRASDFFGPDVVNSTLGERVFDKALANKLVDFLGNAELPHTYSYVPDIASGLATLGTDPRAIGQIWHLPGPETVTTRALLDVLANRLGHPVNVRDMPNWLLRALGLVSPMMRGLAEMSYQFDAPFILDTSKFTTTFGAEITPLEVAISDTVAWYRTRSAS